MGATSAKVGGVGGGGAGVIPEGPGKSQEVRRCAPVNRHVGSEGEGGSCDVSVMKTERHNSFHLPHTLQCTHLCCLHHMPGSHMHQ